MIRITLKTLKLTVAAFGCLVAISSCGAGGDSRVPARFKLSPAQPSVLADLPADGARRLRVRVTAVDNPGAGELGVRAALVDPETGERREIGRFAVFPPERTGDYVLPVSPGDIAAMRGAASKVEFALTSNTTSDPRLLVEFVPVWE